MLDWILDRVRELDEVDEIAPRHEHPLRPRLRALGRPARRRRPRRRHELERGPARRGRRPRASRSSAAASATTTCSCSPATTCSSSRSPSYVAFWRAQGPASAIARLRLGDLVLATHYGVVELDDDDRIVDFVEKPSDPPVDARSTASTSSRREHARAARALPGGGPRAGQRRQLPRLARASEQPVYGYRFRGRWFDIGNHDAAARGGQPHTALAPGLPRRDAYALD